MSASDAPALAAELRAWLLGAPELGLDPGRLRVEYVLNWGGFVNASFHVADGARALHAKLATEPEARAGLRRWLAVAPRLAARYHAPRVVAAIALERSGAEGMLFDHIPGETPDVLPRAVAAEMLAVLRRLHGDAGLARDVARLAPPPESCARAFLDSYVERFDADLAFIAERRPPFVSDATYAWMRDESAALAAAVRASAAFAEPASSAVHADLWASNVRLAPDGGWFLLDWDGISIGDPAMDVAMLLAATSADADMRDALDLLTPLDQPDDDEGAGAFMERLGVYARAILLDWTIDPLADWLAASAVPEHAERVRAEKRRTHERSLARYRARYAG